MSRSRGRLEVIQGIRPDPDHPRSRGDAPPRAGRTAGAVRSDRGGASTQRIVDAIVGAIVERRLRPGTHLAESQIGEMFDVSRTVVRQALNRLSRDRLVTLEPARGARVAEPTVTEAREIFEARAMIESAIVARLAREITRAQIAELRAHLAEERASVEARDVSRRTRLLGDFHQVLVRMLGNRTLGEILGDLLSRSSLIALMYQSGESAGHSFEEHVAIVDALEAGDSRTVQRLMRRHLAHVGDNLGLEPSGGDLKAALLPGARR